MHEFEEEEDAAAAAAHLFVHPFHSIPFHSFSYEEEEDTFIQGQGGSLHRRRSPERTRTAEFTDLRTCGLSAYRLESGLGPLGTSCLLSWSPCPA